MSYEIYYTSAPEGLKRGSSGFCTVAATEGIPKPLWDRLETLSAYRHHFGAAEGETATGQNPTAFAHWILTLSGKPHHVLSRIADAGVDHTHLDAGGSVVFARFVVEDLRRAVPALAPVLRQEPGPALPAASPKP